jgi:hypothetical protein
VEAKDLRETVFGDLSLSQWLKFPSSSAASAAFESVPDFAEADDSRVCDSLLCIASDEKLEIRHRLEALYLARVRGCPPTDFPYEVWGVVVEAGVHGGIDTLAAYADYYAHYYNHAGGCVFWENPDQSLHPLIDDVLTEARAVLPHIGIWGGARRTSLQQGWGRLNILTPQGLCFGEAPLQTLGQDPTSQRLLYAATMLMQKLTGMALAVRQKRK